jgi:hypothetical protein
MKKYVFGLSLLLSFMQCTDNIEPIGECPSLAASEIKYSANVYPIVATTCAIPDCHSAGFEHGDFNLFEDLKLRADNGKLRFMIDKHQMPHGFTDGPTYLTTCEIETIKKWVNEGAKNN